MRLTTLLSAAVSATALTVGLGVGLADGERRPREAPDEPLERISLAAVVPARAPFCDLVPAKAVRTALSATAATEIASSEIVPGKSATLEPGLSDVPHEYGCVYTSGTTTARAWVFGSAVTVATAQQLVDQATADATCQAAGVIRFGNPAAVLDCTSPDGRKLLAIGRLGDSWVHCELVLAPDDATTDLDERGQRWCVAAAYAMAAD